MPLLMPNRGITLRTSYF